MNTNEFNLIATAAFGLEGIVARELERLGINDKETENGRVRFKGDIATIARANMWLRCSDRVLILMGEGHVESFEDLFVLVRSIPWEEVLPVDACFPVDGKSVKSMLHSVPDCQAITKKAIVERMKSVYNKDWFDEDGALYRIEVSILNDNAIITLDTSGAGLHKRGYRKESARAPIKETLAAGMLLTSRWRGDRALIDPFCGSGTIAIEAAMIARNIAPGLKRSFAYEQWNMFDQDAARAVRTEAESLVKDSSDLEIRISASDNDYFAIKQAQENAELAGVQGDISFQKLDFKSISSRYKYGFIISNPPYGERLGEKSEAEQLYREMGRFFRSFDTWSLYFITSFEDFEKVYGRRADKKRKLYNGMIKCNLYQFYGPKPPSGIKR